VAKELRASVNTVTENEKGTTRAVPFA